VGTLQRDAAKEADRILRLAWGDRGIPVDPAKVAHRLGIKVFEAELESDLSGALVKELAEDPAILLNTHDSVNRQRFTCAHELGHYVRRSADLDQYEYVDKRDALAAAGTDPEEIFANSFAAALLMPEAEVRAWAKRGYDEIELASKFGVSREAMHNRLNALRLPG